MAPEGHYQATPVVVDGSADDWPLPPLRFSNAGYTLQYKITNDKKNLVLNAVQGERSGNGPRFSPGGMGGMRGGMGGRRYGSSGNNPGAKEEEYWYQFTPAIK
jgi:hypothetical protein